MAAAPAIVLSSSPPPPRRARPAVGPAIDLSSSPLPPSPNAYLHQLLAKPQHRSLSYSARNHAAEWPARNRGGDIWEVPDNDPRAEEPATTKRKTAAATAATKKRGTKPSKAEKLNTTIKAKVVKSSLVTTGATSKYFGGDQDVIMVEKQTKGKKLQVPKEQQAPRGKKRRSGELLPDHTSPQTTEDVRPVSRSPSPPFEIIRRQWTPVQDTIVESSLASGSVEVLKGIEFGNIIAGMKFSGIDDVERGRSTSTTAEDQTRLEKTDEASIVAARKIAVTTRRKKSKAKKPQTITDFATAKYRIPVASPITDYFPTKGKKPNEGTNPSTLVKPKATRKPRAPVAKRRKRDEEEPAPLLSPTSAMKRFDDQGFVFGTYSQLAKDDESDGGEFVSLPPTPPLPGVDSTFRHTTERMEIGLSRLRGNSATSLWDAAARDIDGKLLDIEVLDLSLPDIPSRVTIEVLSSQDPPPEDRPQANGLVKPLRASSVKQTEDGTAKLPAPSPITALANDETTGSPSTPSNSKPAARKPSVRKTRQPSPTATAIATATTTIAQPEKMPDFSAYPTSRLADELARFGFKSIKKRAVMINYMQRCWEAQHPTVATTDDPKPHERASSKRASSRTPQTSPEEFHRGITKTILEHSGSGKDSWSFRILMYDPIVLEDLARWLNTEGLRKVGIDEEANLSIVRGWCEGQGICCLARETQKGLERKRY